MKPVADEAVAAVLPFLSRTVRAMVTFQRYTGCRPGELVQLRPVDLDTTGPVWIFRPTHHKTLHRGKVRSIAVGPRAQAAVAELLDICPSPTSPVFSPKRAREELNAEKRAKRKTKVQPSQVSRAKRSPKKTPGDQYGRESYTRAIASAVAKADAAARASAIDGGMAADLAEATVFVPHWHPNQLRHTRATEVRRLFGLEAAQVALGHAAADVTQVYAERDMALAVKVAGEAG